MIIYYFVVHQQFEEFMPDATYNLNGGFKPTMKRSADLDGPDFFPTPPWATFALIDNETFEGDIWECACGDGTMSRVLEQTGRPVYSSDLYKRGYGDHGLDFLRPLRSADNIITNPPYNCAEGFVASGVKHARRKFALLLRLAFLEGANRAKTIFAKNPPSRVWVFSERITFGWWRIGPWPWWWIGRRHYRCGVLTASATTRARLQEQPGLLFCPRGVADRSNDLETTLGQISELTGTSDARPALQTMDTDRETRELRALCEQFKQSMHQQTDAPLFDNDAKVRLGQMIGRAALTGSEYAAYPAALGLAAR